MREIRPYFLHTRQNNVIDGRLELEIRKQLALLYQRMRATGQRFGAVRRILPGGTRAEFVVNLNGPQPVLLARVVSSQQQEKEIGGALVLYSGWLGWYLLGYPDRPEDEVWLYSALSTYLDGSGTQLSNWAEPAFLLGTVKDLCNSPKETLPAIENGKYLWPGNVNGSPASRVWTGEARGMDQALSGAGRSWDSVFSVSFREANTWTLPQGDGTGIFWDETGGLWAAEISTLGLRVVRLTIDERLTCFVDALLDPDSFDPADLALIRSWIYAYATVDADATVYTLLTTEINAAYEGGAASLHPRVWWHWRWQPELNSLIQLIITTTRSDLDYYYSKSSDITITVVDGIPSATIQTGPETAWGGSLARVVVPTGVGQQVQVMPPLTEINNVPAVIYRYTTADGNIAEVTRAATIRRSGDYLTDTFPICGAGSAIREYYYNGASSAEAGFTISGSGASGLSGEIIYSGNKNIQTATIKPTGIYNSPSGYGPVGSFCTSYGTIRTDRASATVYESAFDATEEYLLTQGGNGHYSLTILPSDNGVAVGWTQYYDWYRKINKAHYDQKGPTGFHAYACAVDGYNGALYVNYGGEFKGDWGYYPGCFIEVGLGNNRYYYSGFVYPASGTVVEETGKTFYELVLAPSDGKEYSIPGEEWPALFRQDTFTTGNAPEVVASWQGKTAYTPEATSTSRGLGGEFTLPDGVASDAGIRHFLQPIGWA